jgi:hypothetical protein
MQLAIFALILSVISGVGAGISAFLYLRQESLEPTQSEELLFSIWQVVKAGKQFLTVKDKKGQIIQTRDIEDIECFYSKNIENEVKKALLSI